jgi:ATP-binding cassette subfamily B protein RaxB
MGFGTQLGESETCFSAGQRQRLLIARALYRNPKILLLDEALANLSIDSAKQILAVLRASRITTLFVAHDAELIRCADSVVHLAQNSFISQGG